MSFIWCWLYVIIMSRTNFRVNPHTIVCLNDKELLARSRHEIWSLSDCNWTQTHNRLVHKRTINHLAKLAKWLRCVVSTYVYSTFDCMSLPCHVGVQIESTLCSLPECQGMPCSRQVQNLKFKWLQLDSNPQPLSS